MAKKNLLFGVLVLALVFGTMVIGCGEGDTWSPVTSMNQLNGTWKGSVTQSQTDSGITVKATVEMEYIFTSSSSTVGTISGSMKMTLAFSGSTVDFAWVYISSLFDPLDGWIVNNIQHTATLIEDITEESVSITQVNAIGIEINQNGNKIKISEEVEVMGESETVEFIMYKQ